MPRPILVERRVSLDGLPGQMFTVRVETTHRGSLIARAFVAIVRPDGAALETAHFELPVSSLRAVAQAFSEVAGELGVAPKRRAA